MNVNKTSKFLKPRQSLTAAVVLMAVVLIWMSSVGLAENFQAKDEAANLTSIFPGDSWERIVDPTSAGYSAEGLEKVRQFDPVALPGLPHLAFHPGHGPHRIFDAPRWSLGRTPGGST